MAVGISQVLASRPEDLVRAAGDVAAAAADIDMQLSRERMQMTRLASDWTGTASDTARGHADEMFGDQEIYRDRLRSLQAEMSSGGSGLARIRGRLSDLVSSPEASNFDIADDGTVQLGTRLKFLAMISPVLAMTFGLRRLALQTAIQTALAEFEAEDKATAYQMDRINQGLVK